MGKKQNGGPMLFVKNGGKLSAPSDRPGGPLISYYAKKGGKIQQANFTNYSGTQMYGTGGNFDYNLPSMKYSQTSSGQAYKNGGTIHINPANKGKFNATKARTGKSTEELTHSSNPVTKKRAVFAQNAAKWKHANGGPLLVGNQHVAMGGPLYKKYYTGGPFGIEDVDPNDPKSQAMWAAWEAEKQRRLAEGQPERPDVSRMTEEDEGPLLNGIRGFRDAGKNAAAAGVLNTEQKKLDLQRKAVGDIYTGTTAAATSLMSNFSESNRVKQQGAHNDGSNAAFLGASSGMAQGAALGNKIAGPLGAFAGTVIGGTAGYITGNKKGKELKKQYNSWQDDYMQTENMRTQASNNRYADFRPTTSGMYADGGSLATNYMAKQKAVGGNLVPLSSDSVEVQGPSHAQGGVQLPQAGAEVEGKEVIKDDYVFSDQLGFAKEAKKFAKAKGTIEDKPASRERLNSLKLLESKENQLKLAQEFIRKQQNLQ